MHPFVWTVVGSGGGIGGSDIGANVRQMCDVMLEAMGRPPRQPRKIKTIREFYDELDG